MTCITSIHPLVPVCETPKCKNVYGESGLYASTYVAGVGRVYYSGVTVVPRDPYLAEPKVWGAVGRDIPHDVHRNTECLILP